MYSQAESVELKLGHLIDVIFVFFALLELARRGLHSHDSGNEICLSEPETGLCSEDYVFNACFNDIPLKVNLGY